MFFNISHINSDLHEKKFINLIFDQVKKDTNNIKIDTKNKFKSKKEVEKYFKYVDVQYQINSQGDHLLVFHHNGFLFFFLFKNKSDSPLYASKISEEIIKKIILEIIESNPNLLKN